MKLLKFLASSICILGFSAATAFAGPVNSKCPVSGEDVEEGKDAKVAVTFCCEKCKGKFDKDPASFIEKVAKAEEGKCPVSGEAADKEQTSDLVVGTCCGKCKAKVEEDPKKFLGKLKAK
jgi:YHS domain-containing protein